MKIVVIGGTGIIGMGIVEAAVSKGYDVISFSRKINPIHNSSAKVRNIKVDWNDDKQAKSAFADINCDVVVNGLIFDVKRMERDLEIVKGHCKHFIYISTAGIYEQPAILVSEDAPKDPDKLMWTYSINKRKAELYLEHNYTVLPFLITIVRPPFTYGNTRIPCAMTGRKNQWTLIKRIIDGKPIVFIDDERSKHAITHISTFSNAVVELFMNSKADRQAFHISDDNAYTWEDVANEVGKYLRKTVNIIHIPIEALKNLNEPLYMEIKYNKTEELTLDNNKIKSFAPQVRYSVSLNEGLKKTIDFLKEKYSDYPLDEDFNRICDVLIMEYKRFNLEEEERKNAMKYINGFSKVQRHRLQCYSIEKKLTTIMKRRLRPIKNVIKQLKKHFVTDLKEK